MKRKISPEKRKEYRENYKKSGGAQRDRARRKLRLLNDPVFAAREAQKRRDYYNSKKVHLNEWSRQHRKNNPDQLKVWRYKSWRFNRATLLLSKIRSKCREDGLAFTLTKEWLQSRIDAGVCELSGMSFDMEQKRGPLSPTVDRIDASGGYTIENCRVIIWYLNRALSNLGEGFAIEVFKRVIQKRAQESGFPALSMVA